MNGEATRMGGFLSGGVDGTRTRDLLRDRPGNSEDDTQKQGLAGDSPVSCWPAVGTLVEVHPFAGTFLGTF